jgi:hypothetical protein
MWLENALHEHAATSTLPQFQNPPIGTIVPDWGGGSLKVLDIVPNHYVVYGSIHGTASSSAAVQNDYAFTWTLALESRDASSTSFHVRLRLKAPTHGIGKYISPTIPGLIDYATDVVMFKGLQERLQK